MNSTLLGYLAVFFGGGIGASLRHGVNRMMLAAPDKFPLSTLVINVLGCLIMGALAGWFVFRGAQTDQTTRLFLTTGILGGFTTFSAFSLDAALLWQRHDLMGFFGYVLGTMVLCLVAVFAGLALTRMLLAH
ncbi:MAG: fluoride efflux transporter CrcB [Caulobacterales bacterium]